MIALQAGVVVYAHGREWVGEIPSELCPDYLKPENSTPVQGKGVKAPVGEASVAP